MIDREEMENDKPSLTQSTTSFASLAQTVTAWSGFELTISRSQGECSRVDYFLKELEGEALHPLLQMCQSRLCLKKKRNFPIGSLVGTL